jgi:hypothetical protein
MKSQTNHKNSEETSSRFNFFHKLREKTSNTIITELYNFINTQIDDILKKEKISNIPTIIQDYISNITFDFVKAWDLADTIKMSSVDIYIEIVEGFEALITKSLYAKLMNIFQEDTSFDKICKKFNFLSLKHLDLDILLDEFELEKKLRGI